MTCIRRESCDEVTARSETGRGSSRPDKMVAAKESVATSALKRKRGRQTWMGCMTTDCSGEYESRKIAHLERWDGDAVVIDHVAVEAWSLCGDVLFTPETVRRLELLRHAPSVPAATAPGYEFRPS